MNRRQGIPLLGGLRWRSVCSCALSLGIVVMELAALEGPPRGLLIGGTLLLAIGVVDDRYGLRALPKLAVQIVAAAAWRSDSASASTT